MFLLGYIMWHPTGRPAVHLRQSDLLGLPVACLEIQGRAGFFLARKVRKAVGRMRLEGVRQGCWMPDLPPLWHEGIVPVEVWSLRRALLPQLIACAERQWGLDLMRGTVWVTAEETNASVWQAAEFLAQHCRYVRLDTGMGQAALESHMQRRYGLAPGGRGMLLQISFDGQGGLRTICLDRQAERQQRVFYQPPAGWPETVPLQEQLLAALWQAGRLSVEEICVKSIGPMLDRAAETLYNAT